MRKEKGSLTFRIGKEEYSLNDIDVIILDEDENNEKNEGVFSINKFYTEEHAYSIIKSFLGNQNNKECLHDINLYLGKDITTLIAHADNFSKDTDNFTFKIEEVK